MPVLSLRTVLALSFAALSVLVTGSTAVLVGVNATDRLQRDIGDDLNAVAAQMAFSLDCGLNNRLHEIEALAAIIGGMDPASIPAQRDTLRRLQRVMPFYADIAVIDRQGHIVATASGAPGMPAASVESGRDYFRNDIQRPFISDAHASIPLRDANASPSSEPQSAFSDDDAPRFMNLAAPVLDVDGKVSGVVTANLYWQWVSKVAATFAAELRHRHPGAELLIVAKDGAVLHGAPPMRALRLPLGLFAADAARVVAWPAGDRSVVGYAVTTGYEDNPGLGWRVVVRQDLRSAMAPVRQLERQILATGLLATLLAALLGWWLAERLARPFEHLASMARRLEIGDALPSPSGAVVREIQDCVRMLNRAAHKVRRHAHVSRQQAAETRAIFESAPLPLILLDCDLRCVAANDAMGIVLGFIPTAMAGRRLQSMLPISLAETLEPLLRQAVLVGKRIRDLEIIAPIGANRDGAASIANWLLNISPVRQGAEACQVTGISLAIMDITHRRRAEDILRLHAVTLERRVHERTAALEAEMEQRGRAEAALIQAQRIDAVGQLTGGVAHDFNNLLTAVLGCLELASRRTPDADIARLLQSARGAAERGARLTRQLLAFSRKQNLDVQSTDLNTLIMGMEDLLSRTLGPSVRINYRLSPGLWLSQADRSQVELALVNLVINARDAMGGQGTIEVESANLGDMDPALPAELRGDFVMVSVRDHGGGMTPDILARCMEPFFTTKPLGKGTGLGLSMVFGLAKQLGGTVRIDSVPDQGTTVRFFLPCAAPVADRPVLLEPSGIESFFGLRVLLVDDDPDVREVTAAHLESIGCQASAHPDGPAALRALTDAPSDFDVLLTDFAMPGMTGAELAQASRRLRPDLPVVVVTGYADPENNAGLAAEFAEVSARLTLLAKPYTGVQLSRMLRKVLIRNGIAP